MSWWSERTDAQRASLIAIFVYIGVIALLYWLESMDRWDRKAKSKGLGWYLRGVIWGIRWIVCGVLLWPFTQITVLFHELSHAAVAIMM